MKAIHTTHLRPLVTGMSIGPTRASQTLTSNEIFVGGVYGLLPHHSLRKPTVATIATSFTATDDGTLEAIFGSLGAERRHWQEEEIIWLVACHRHELHPTAANFVEMEGGLVGDIRLNPDGSPKIQGIKFSLPAPYMAVHKHRVFVLQR